MKCALFVLFALFFVSSVLSDVPCMTFTCVPAGGNCSADSVSNKIIMPMCQKGYYCNNSTCTSQIALGGACTDPHLTLGLECVGSDQLKSICYQNTCQAITKTLSAGGNCSSPVTQCSEAYYCDFQTQLCTEFPSKGENCSSRCAAGLACNLGTCIAQYSVAAGQACQFVAANDVSDSCAAGLYCKPNGTLHSGICAAGFVSSNAACNDTIACSNTDETCICNKCTAPVTVTASQATTLVKLDQCVANTNCDPTVPASCCKEYQCAAHKFSLSFYMFAQMNKASTACGYTEFNFCNSVLGRMSTYEKIAIAVGAVAGIVIIAGLIIFCVRRRNSQYQMINN